MQYIIITFPSEWNIERNTLPHTMRDKNIFIEWKRGRSTLVHTIHNAAINKKGVQVVVSEMLSADVVRAIA